MSDLVRVTPPVVQFHDVTAGVTQRVDIKVQNFSKTAKRISVDTSEKKVSKRHVPVC